MTVLCGLHLKDEGTWIASDRLAVVASDRKGPSPVQKWFPVAGWWLGLTGEPAAMSAAKRALKDDAVPHDDPEQLAHKIMSALRDAGFVASTSTGAPCYDQTWIMANPSGIWDMCSGGSVVAIEPGQPWARGSGAEYALGAGFAVPAVRDVAPETIVRMMVLAACQYCTSCGLGVWAQFLPWPSTA